jgi:hypothetical protein
MPPGARHDGGVLTTTDWDEGADMGDHDPPYAVIMTTTWACSAGHVERESEDLGDPADRERVMRSNDEIRFGGCRVEVDGARCGRRCLTARTERKEYL